MKSGSRIVLVDVIGPHRHREDAVRNLSELKSLVETYNGIDIVDIIQHRNMPDKATFIGSGKVLELMNIIRKKKIDIVIINSIVNPRTISNLTKILWEVNPDIMVWDRVDLILNIFDKHASSSEAKLQIEIARMRHMGPRIYGLGKTYFSRQGGGIGTRGGGETNIELMKRHWQTRINNKQAELDKLSAKHLLQIERRKRNDIPGISIVGYTNAGKTSLFNLLTKKMKAVKNALFVTLESSTGSFFIEGKNMTVTVSDTIGFIRDLPATLIDSFKTTLLESVHSDIIIHLIDITDPEMDVKIETVEKILNDLNVRSKKIIYVFNKIDAYREDGGQILKRINGKYLKQHKVFISVRINFGIDKLKSKIESFL